MTVKIRLAGDLYGTFNIIQHDSHRALSFEPIIDRCRPFRPRFCHTMAAFQWKTDYTLLNGLRANGQKAKGRRRRRYRRSFGNGTNSWRHGVNVLITLLMLHGITRLIRIVFSTRMVWFRFFRRPKHESLPRERQRRRRRRKIKSCCLAHFSNATLLSIFSIVNIILLLFSFYGDVYNIIILASLESIEHGEAENWINYAQMIDRSCDDIHIIVKTFCYTTTSWPIILY